MNPFDFDTYPHLVKNAISLIESSYAYLYGIDDLAEQLEVSKYHLIRCFSASTGLSPGQYLINIRLYHAKILLQSDIDVSYEVIAGACGYSCGNYFSKAFKKHTGMTPTEYAQSSRNESISAANDQINSFYL